LITMIHGCDPWSSKLSKYQILTLISKIQYSGLQVTKFHFHDFKYIYQPYILNIGIAWYSNVQLIFKSLLNYKLGIFILFNKCNLKHSDWSQLFALGLFPGSCDQPRGHPRSDWL
jgi:hypothetical protein